MRVSKFLSIVSFFTCFSILYVYQQSEIFRLAYAGGKKQTALAELLDKNTVLRYNIGRNTSLVHIGSKVSGNADFQMPDSYRLVRLRSSRQGLSLAEGLVSKQTLLSRLFGIKVEAEAKTVNPSTSLRIDSE